MTAHPPDQEDIHLTLRRRIDAPLEAVYAAWTDPDLLSRWLAPDDAVVARAVAEVRVGGQFLLEMLGKDGRKWVTQGRYREVVPNRRLVHTWCWEGSDHESLVTVEFEPERPGTTRLTVTHSRLASSEARDNHERGWSSCLAKLDALHAETEGEGQRRDGPD